MSLLEQVQSRIDKVMDEIGECNDKLRDEDFAFQYPDEYQGVDFKATRLDGRLEELQWVKKQLEEDK